MRSYKLVIITLLFIFLFSLTTSVSTKAEPVAAVIDFEGIPPGTIVHEMYSGYGISGAEIEGFVIVDGYNPDFGEDINAAMIFDAICPPNSIRSDCTGNDGDLLNPTLGNTMIISEDLDTTDPDDADVVGSTFGFEYSQLGDGAGARIESITVQDVEEEETEDARMYFYEGGLDGVEVGSVDIPETGDGNSAIVTIGVDDVDAIRVDLQGSGEIDNIQLSAEPTAVGLIYFRVDYVGDGTVDLSWATEWEDNNYGFNIYRSEDNYLEHKELVHFEPAFGGSGGHTYYYTDTPPDEGPYWYWLSDIDNNGVETFHMPKVVRTLHSHFNYLPILTGR